MSWQLTSHGWLHRPWWKVAINTFLRSIQPQSRKWVIYSRVVYTPPEEVPILLGYGFGPILHTRS